MTQTPKLLAALCALAAIFCSCAGSKQHPDLVLHELKGPVKEVVLNVQSADQDKRPLDAPLIFTYAFSADGSLLSEDGKTFTHDDFKRDDSGRLIEIQNNQDGEVFIDETRNYTYNGSHAYPDTIFVRISGEVSNYTTTANTYDEEGNLISAHNRLVFDGNISDSRITYEILERDAQGNWTKRFATITETEQLLDENCELGAPVTQTRYMLQTRHITYWDAPEQSASSAPSTSTAADEAEPSIFDECYDKQNLESVVFYVAQRDAKAYERPDATSPVVEEQGCAQGVKIMAESGAASFTEYDEDWYEWSWRGESYYFKRSDFERKTLQVCRRIATSFIQSGKEMWFRAEDGSTITLSILDTNGYTFHPLEEGSQEIFNLKVGKQVYIMQFGGEYGSEPYVLGQEDDFVSLCGMGSYISRTPNDVNDCEGVAIGSKLTCDAWHVIFPDPDFCFEVYYVPTEQALLLNGALYHFIKTTDIE